MKPRPLPMLRRLLFIALAVTAGCPRPPGPVSSATTGQGAELNPSVPVNTVDGVGGEPVPLPPVVDPGTKEAQGAVANATPLSRGLQAVKRAAGFVGIRSLKRITKKTTDDCTGFIQLVFGALGVELLGAVPHIYQRAKEVGALHKHRPSEGDLVFFRETYDRNRDGKRNDGMTHVGLVESVDAAGTVTFIHRGKRGVERSRMNLELLHKRKDQTTGETLNDFLRPARGASRAYTAGELFTGYADVEAL
ncbi:MAG: NlpC/P60 family protein [Myxococcaceae bacterium]